MWSDLAPAPARRLPSWIGPVLAAAITLGATGAAYAVVDRVAVGTRITRLEDGREAIEKRLESIEKKVDVLLAR